MNQNIMTQSSTRKWLNLWHCLLDDPAIPPFKKPDEMAGVLADLRCDRERLAKAFQPLPCGEEILTRLQFCIGAEPDHETFYLVPSPLESTDDELRSLVLDSIHRASQCCGTEPPSYPIHIYRRTMTAEEWQRTSPLSEDLGDLYCGIPHESNGREIENEAMLFLSETLYTLAASFEVQGYCLTPLCPAEIRRIDPYEPQVQLWRRGAHAVIPWKKGDDDCSVEVYV